MNIVKNTAFLTVALFASTTYANTNLTVPAENVQAAINPPVVEAVQKNDTTVLVSPRTGMRYSVNNPSNVPIIFKTELLAPATAANADRIIASNPALSAESQAKAKQALIDMVTAPVAP